MNVIRQETDYALRLMAVLAAPNGEQQKSVSTRVLAEKSDVSYEFACKILQKLHEAGLIESIMGPKGGYKLHKEPRDITLFEVIAAVQGPLSVNDCMCGCKRKEKCPLSDKMAAMQKQMDDYLHKITLEEAIKERIKS
jgi:Rrf2 family transcriptional regulator, iron-sulfur cluster assembly transcription factor